MSDKKHLPPVAVSILFFILISLGPLLYLHNRWLDEIENQSRVQDHLGQARENLAQAHLWFEEMLTGDPNVRPQQVWDLFMQARQSLERFQIEQFQIDPALLEFVPHQGEAVSQLLVRLSDLAHSLESLAQTRSGSQTDSSAGTAIDEEFDRLFTQTLAASFDVERAVREYSNQRMKDRKEIHWLTLLFWGIGAAGTGLGLIVVNRKRRHMEQEKRLLEAQFQQAQKLESLGVLAGGIAHDFNNLLMEISGNTSLLLCQDDLTDEVRLAITEIEAGAQKAAGLTAQMLAYAGKGKFIESIIDFNDMIREMDSLLTLSVSKRVAVDYQLSKQRNAIKCNPAQLQQVVMNLLINASEACESNGGSIIVTTRQQTIDSNTYLPQLASKVPAKRALPESGKYVVLEIKDSGSGMPRELVDRCFEPFFSTKFTGRGLGLSAVLGIVEAHNGAITLESELNVGTTFTIYIPLTDQLIEQKPDIKQDKSVAGSGRILVIDDDETVVRMIIRMLIRLGYEVESVDSGELGIAKLSENPQNFDVAIIDMEMPGMSGEEVATEIRSREILIGLILSSGYTRDVLSGQNAGELFDAFIQKPYRVQELSEAVSAVMSSRQSAKTKNS